MNDNNWHALAENELTDLELDHVIGGGYSYNGLSYNGLSYNGTSFNGAKFNGVGNNGFEYGGLPAPENKNPSAKPQK